VNGTKKKMTPANGAPHRDLVILLAEDDDGHAELTLAALREAGVSNEVIRFRDGEETIAFFAEQTKGKQATRGTPYLLLLDLAMPKVDGFAVLTHLKGTAAYRKIPIIVFTTDDDPAVIERCYTLGCNAYVTKPVTYKDLAEKMRKIGIGLVAIEVPRL